jgi:hypothetical protein
MTAYVRIEDRALAALADGHALTVDEIFGECDEAQRKKYRRALGDLVLSSEVTKRGNRYRLRGVGGLPMAEERPERKLAPWSNGLPDRKVTLPHGLAALLDQCPPPGDVWPEKVKVLLAIAAQFDALWPDEED